LRNTDLEHTGCVSESCDCKNATNSKCFHLFLTNMNTMYMKENLDVFTFNLTHLTI
jgi:hypothetical protein